MNSWYSISDSDNGAIDIFIHGEIGSDGIGAIDFINELRQRKAVTLISLTVDSPGGNAIDGLVIYQVLKSHPATIHGYVKGTAASAASFILMASNSISMTDDSHLVIHNAESKADDSDSMANTMNTLQNSIANIYIRRTGKSDSFIRNMMQADTWLNASDSLKYGFVDAVTN